MKPAKYSRSCLRSRKVKMSDCHIWLGSALSKLRGGCSRAPALGLCSMSPASCRMRRTSVSLTPSASKRPSTSRILRVPYSGWSCRRLVTACWRVWVVADASCTGRPGGLGVRASSPPLSYLASQLHTVVLEIPKALHTCPIGMLPSTTSCTTRSLTLRGYPTPRAEVPALLPLR